MRTLPIRTRPSSLLTVAALTATWLAAASLTTTSHAHAQAATERAQSYLEGRHRAVQSLLRRPASVRRNHALDDLLGQLLDFDAVSRAALGDEWERRSPEERQAFRDLLRQLVQKNYQRNLQSTLEVDVRYLGAEEDGDTIVVRTEARSRTNRRAPPVSIDYRVRAEGNTWRVVDISTDGSSMVRSYRRQFRRIIRRDGWEGLITRMRAQLEAEPAT